MFDVTIGRITFVCNDTTGSLQFLSDVCALSPESAAAVDLKPACDRRCGSGRLDNSLLDAHAGGMEEVLGEWCSELPVHRDCGDALTGVARFNLDVATASVEH